ncbi:hypothetical protein [Streptomyces violarus]|uniref:Mg-chelatase subunit ChlD n=1 Tax=Streptomyces violarus TaxID=67380 RepID=A0A7W4ZJM9_9ACTN|nr:MULTISPECIES: hypothetical protein [Streptomyces]MBB3073704.1 Mg-chelatase subunit ChlD [Streptomyces violarus]WRT96460.1 hypothetical protein VJ737_01625 [Streptomyces sp. CGMCC 4.1772]
MIFSSSLSMVRAAASVLGLIRDQLRRRIRLAVVWHSGKTPQTASVIVD